MRGDRRAGAPHARRSRPLGAVGAGLLILIGAASAADAQGPPAAAVAKPATSQPASRPATREALCPVSGARIDRQYWTEFRGKKVYFATAAARDAFAKDPYEYAEGVQRQWEALWPLRVQVLCPVTGKPIDPGISLERAGELVWFATADARASWLKEPQRYERKLEECYTFQTRCPCGVGEIKPGVMLSLKDRTVYFCCPGCRAAFQREPTPPLAKLDEQIQANKEAWAKQRPPRPAEPL